MRRFLLLLCLGITTAATSFAQLGKMQYEDAEEQFSAGKFMEALTLLDESEKTMGKSNPMIEHLRIMTRTELLKKDLAANVDQLEIAQNEAKAFLTKYDGDTRLEDKYREVYKASKALAAFPTKEEIAKQAAEEKRKEEEKRREETANFIPGYKDGLTAEETKNKIAGFTTQHTTSQGQTLYFNNRQEMVFISPKTGRSFGYMMHYQFPDCDKECTGAFSKYLEKKAEITRLLGAEPVERKPEDTAAQNRFFSSKWTKGTKTITLSTMCVQTKRSINGSVMIMSDNAQYR